MGTTEKSLSFRRSASDGEPFRRGARKVPRLRSGRPKIPCRSERASATRNLSRRAPERSLGCARDDRKEFVVPAERQRRGTFRAGCVKGPSAALGTTENTLSFRRSASDEEPFTQGARKVPRLRSGRQERVCRSGGAPATGNLSGGVRERSPGCARDDRNGYSASAASPSSPAPASASAWAAGGWAAAAARSASSWERATVTVTVTGTSGCRATRTG